MALYAASQFEQFGLDLRPEPEGRFVATGFALKETERDIFTLQSLKSSSYSSVPLLQTVLQKT